MRRRMQDLPAGTYEAEDCLDEDGSSTGPVVVKVRVDVSADRLVIDFAGSSQQRPGNVNAVAPMTQSATFFAVKLLIDPTLPANAGVLRLAGHPHPARQLPGGAKSRPPCAPATRKTTQRVADTVLRAFAAIAPDRIPAASQGTMNLISVGGTDPRTVKTYTYIETICGGQGGRPRGAGMDGVQVNMTNTMNTPIEALEISLPAARRKLRAA